MVEENKKGENHQMQEQTKTSDEELDVAGKSLSEALRISFIILKVIMIVLVIAFLASGFRTVSPDEKALVLRFGKIRGVTEDRILGPGAHWVFPHPIDEVVKIPVEKKINLAINSFWYKQTKEDILGEGPKKRAWQKDKLDPVEDGYCLTRSERNSDEIHPEGASERTLQFGWRIEYQIGDLKLRPKDFTMEIKQPRAFVGSEDSDYNIVHSKWQLIYKIDDIEQFFKNVYVDDLKPGEVYFDVITKSITPLLQCIVENAIVTAMVNYTIDEAIVSKDRIPRHVRSLVQQKLDEIESGIKVVSMYLTDITWPKQVDEAFLASIKASQESQRAVSEARTYAENTLNEAGGPIAEQLLSSLYDDNVSEQQKEYLWSHLAGQAQEKIAGARAYRTEIVESARANAEYLQSILPEYRKRPELVVQQIYQDTIEYVLNNADEKFIIQPNENAGSKELRIILNRDPTLKPKTEKLTEEKRQ